MDCLRRLFLLLIVSLMSSWVMGQDNGLNPVYSVEVRDLEYEIMDKKESVGGIIGTITGAVAGVTTDHHYENQVASVNASVKSGLDYVRRFRAVDALNQDEPGFVVTGKITNLSTTSTREVRESKDSKGKVKKTIIMHYDATASVVLTLVNSISGETTTHKFTDRNYSYAESATADKTLMKAIEGLKGQIYYYYNTMFPLTANVIEQGLEKKDKTNEIYLDLGEAIGAYQGLHFDIFQISTVAGREAKKKIGRVKIKDVMGDDICLCKVQKGGKEIKVALDEKVQLKAISTD